MGENERKLIGIKELVMLTGVSVATINRRKRNGLLPHHKIGSRVVLTPEDVQEFLDSCKVDAKKEAQ
jgi:predicted DNA-binding transcriptional regulator AlpA